MSVSTNYTLEVITKCPKCLSAYAIKIVDVLPKDYESDIQCSNCHLDFHTDIALAVRYLIVRAKRSKQNKKNNTRFFSIRVIEQNGQEALIEFEKTGIEDFELRARDRMYLFNVETNSSQSKEPSSEVVQPYRRKSIVIHNLTIRKRIEVIKFETSPKPKAPEGACFFATYLYGESSKEVALLRQYRDDVLMRYKSGKLLVEIYYFLSPKIIETFGSDHIFRRTGLILMRPIISGVKYSQRIAQR